MKFWGLLAMVAPIAHIRQENSLIGSSSKIKLFHVVMTLTLISQSLYNLSQQELYHTYPLLIYTCHTSHILWKNLQAYNIGDSVQC